MSWQCVKCGENYEMTFGHWEKECSRCGWVRPKTKDRRNPEQKRLEKLGVIFKHRIVAGVIDEPSVPRR